MKNKIANIKKTHTHRYLGHYRFVGKGLSEGLNLCDTGVEDKTKKQLHSVSDLNVIKYYRFEGANNPDDNSVHCIIETPTDEKGLLVDTYGNYLEILENDRKI